jgi:HAD superfamily 5'-nucleotidase-like hydrolase
MRTIKAIGYDMDYTLVGYHAAEWEARAYGYLKANLIEAGWDLPAVHALTFDAARVIRGLVVDQHKGNLLKVNRFAYVKRARHGSKLLSIEDLRAAYTTRAIDLTDERYVLLDTLFSLSEGCIFAQLVDVFDAQGLPGVHDYHGIWAWVRRALDEAHIEGELKRDVLADPDTYLVRDPLAARTLIEQKNAGKKLLLITNSGWAYSRQVMALAFDHFLPGEMTWRDLFDVVIVAARKPGFFSGTHRLFEVMDDAGEHLRPFTGVLSDEGVYLGGDAAQLEGLLGLSGDEILYVGDHIYGDVIVSKNLLDWRTCLVLAEMEQESNYLQAIAAMQVEVDALMLQKQEFEIDYDRLRCMTLPPGAPSNSDDQLALREQLVAIDQALGQRLRAMADHSNPYWGPLMRAGADESLVAQQVERYACVYTSRVSSLGMATPFHYFRAKRSMLPHDL